jgi:hypothetical protein
MKRTIDEHKNIILSWKKDISEEYKGRTISISTDLPSIYRRYKEKIKLRTFKPSEVSLEGSEVNRMITSLNSTV